MSQISSLPTLNDSFGLADLIDYRASVSPEEPFALLAADDARPAGRITFLEFARGCYRFASAVSPKVPVTNGEVVGLLVNCDSVMYVTAIAGLVRAGLTPFPISHRNSADAVCHILRTVRSHRVITTTASLGELVGEVCSKLSAERYDIRVDELPVFTNIYPQFGTESHSHEVEKPPRPSRSAYANGVVFYIHSSGSTGFPKSIPYSWDYVARIDHSPWTTEIDSYNGHLSLASMSLPSFHTMGIYVQLITPLYTGRATGLFSPRYPRAAIVPSPANTIAAFESAGCNAAVTVPTFLETWAREPESVEKLKKLDFLLFGGGPLLPAVGDMLAEAGVRLVSIYGGTEFGVPIRLIDSKVGRGRKDWSYLELSDIVQPRWISQGDGTYELQLLTTENYPLAIENISDCRGYATNDLFTPHPTKKGLWKITGRADDVLTLATGEKTVPGPIESVIAADPDIQAVVMFGRERNQVGILVEPHPQHSVDPSDAAALASFRNHIWPSVEKANSTSPAFSRIFKEMILITSPNKPLPRTPKGTIIRKAAIALYEKEIEALYVAADDSGEVDSVTPPTSWNAADLTHWLANTAAAIQNGRSVDVNADLFEQGFDSLSATSLRNNIIRAMRVAEDPAVRDAMRQVGNGFIYSHPTVVELARGIVALLRPGEDDQRGEHIRAIRQMIDNFSVDMHPIDTSHKVPLPVKRTVLITGTTGGLGSQLLAMCLVNPMVERVYAFNRPSSKASFASRQAHSFLDRGLDTSLLDSEKLVYLGGDAGSSWLGLERETYETVRKQVTTIIHNAWRLDFNLALSSFASNVRGTRNLLDLALASPNAQHIRFLFTSSIAVSNSWSADRGPFPEEPITMPEVAIGSGYGESKYVCEQLLVKASEMGLQTTSFRIGQITGGSESGAWATTDWFPILVKSSVALGCLPEARGLASWLPFGAVAQTILDVAALDGRPELALNVVHPHPVSWKEVVENVADVLVEEGIVAERLPIVSFGEWHKKLQTASAGADESVITRIPAIKLADFFAHQAASDEGIRKEGRLQVEAGGLSTLSTAKAQVASPALRELAQLGKQDVRRWVEYWASKGFFVETKHA